MRAEGGRISGGSGDRGVHRLELSQQVSSTVESKLGYESHIRKFFEHFIFAFFS